MPILLPSTSKRVRRCIESLTWVSRCYLGMGGSTSWRAFTCLFVLSHLPRSVMDTEGCEGVGISSLVLFLHKVCTMSKGMSGVGKEHQSYTQRALRGGTPDAGFPSIASVICAVAHAAPDVSQRRDTPLSLSCPQGASRSDRQISPRCPGPSHLRTGRARLYDLAPCPRCRTRR